MIASYNINQLLENEDGGVNPIKFYSFIKSLNSFAGFIGAYLFVPFGYGVGGIVLFRIKRQKKEIKKQAQLLINNVSNLELQSIRNIHLKVEQLNRKSQLALKENSNNEETPTFYRTLFRSIDKEIEEYIDLMNSLENTLKNAAYPNIIQDLSKDDYERLKNCYNNIDTSGWDNEELDVYEDYYVLNK